MTTVKIQAEDKEETILREFRHCRTLLAEEITKLERLDAKINDLRERRKGKRECIERHTTRLATLRSKASAIFDAMLKEADE